MPFPVPTWLPDDLLDDDQRTILSRFITPRRGLDGALYWSTAELGVQE